MDIRCPNCDKLLMVIHQRSGWHGELTLVCRRCPKDKLTGETTKIRIAFPHPLGSEWVPMIEKV